MTPRVFDNLPTRRLSIPLSQYAELRLRQRAVAEGLPLEEFARHVLERETLQAPEMQSAETWIDEWRRWTNSRPRQELTLDDSRASMYE